MDRAMRKSLMRLRRLHRDIQRKNKRLILKIEKLEKSGKRTYKKKMHKKKKGKSQPPKKV